MAKKMAVITGTFNPVTIAHLEMGRIARRELGHETLVVYVPAQAGFLQSWKHMKNTEIISDQLRCEMLKAALELEGFFCDTCEIDGTVSGKTYDTLDYLADKFRMEKKDIYFVCGSDKLEELESWSHAEELVTEYHFLVIRRNYEDVPQIINKNPFLSPWKAHFQLTENEGWVQNISATQIREALSKGQLSYTKEKMPEPAYHILERNYYGY